MIESICDLTTGRPFENLSKQIKYLTFLNTCFIFLADGDLTSALSC